MSPAPVVQPQQYGHMCGKYNVWQCVAKLPPISEITPFLLSSCLKAAVSQKSKKKTMYFKQVLLKNLSGI